MSGCSCPCYRRLTLCQGRAFRITPEAGRAMYGKRRGSCRGFLVNGKDITEFHLRHDALHPFLASWNSIEVLVRRVFYKEKGRCVIVATISLWMTRAGFLLPFSSFPSLPSFERPGSYDLTTRWSAYHARASHHPFCRCWSTFGPNTTESHDLMHGWYIESS